MLFALSPVATLVSIIKPKLKCLALVTIVGGAGAPKRIKRQYITKEVLLSNEFYEEIGIEATSMGK